MSTNHTVAERSTQFTSFVIERTFSAPVARVYNAFADEEAKSRWFSGPDAWKEAGREFNFVVGGREYLKGVWNDGTVSEFTCMYNDIVPRQRIVYTYAMNVNDKRISVSLATLEFTPDGERTHMKMTEQAVYLDGYPTPEDRITGTEALFDRLEASL